MKQTSSFHAHHSSMGSHSSFTVGMFGAQGGMALEKGSPADSGAFIGYKTASGVIHYLPFFENIANDAERYSHLDEEYARKTKVFGENEITREYQWATDRFKAPGITFEILTPFFPIADPATASVADLKFSSCPVTFLTLEIENSSNEVWEGFFALQNRECWSPFSEESELKGFKSRERMGFATRDPVEAFSDFSVEQALERDHTNPTFLLGPVAGINFSIPPGESRKINLVLGYYIEGQATFNYPAKYWYTQYFTNLQNVFDYAIESRERYLTEVAARDAELAAAPLSDAQKFLIAHSTRSYYGSTEWLDVQGKPIWVVNEGEYLMMNTLDLTVDMLFFELKFNPWTVRNVLEQFVERYSYMDEIFDPLSPEQLHPGGISFTHDMGVANHFSPAGSSSYECSGLDRECFSFMTCEQLTNWVLCAGVYMVKTDDSEFLHNHRDIFLKSLVSLLRRDHPEPGKRNGLMGFESSRTEGGGEITTYDSLDHSLGQARNNVYLAGKCWASYIALEHLFLALEERGPAMEAHAAALRCATTLQNAFDETKGFIPAVLENGTESAIIPATEALIYPWKMGLEDAVAEDGPFGGYIRMLKRHVKNVLKPGVCLYEDGGWKLSSSADNSWVSKICLNQYVVREILGINYEGEERADAAHVQWEVEGSKFQACSDQFSSGKPIGSLYYPRIVTSILWMDEVLKQKVESKAAKTYNTLTEVV